MAKTFVLLHGAWHGGWCWTHVEQALRARGHRVSAPTQTGLGERCHLISADITLETFADDLINHILAEDLTDAVLVGHSFGGNAISVAAERIPDRIAELIYLDSTIVLPGQCPFDVMPAEVVSERIRIAEESSGGISIPVPSAAAFGVLDPAQAAWLEPRLTPHPLSTMQSPIPLDDVPGKIHPVRYFVCTDPIYPALSGVRDWVRQAGWATEEIATGHNAMVSAPEVLVEMLHA